MFLGNKNKTRQRAVIMFENMFEKALNKRKGRQWSITDHYKSDNYIIIARLSSLED